VRSEDSVGKTTPAESLNLERFLATLYVDPAARARFLAAPEAEASRAGLSPQQCMQLREIDFTGLEMASRSFARKRAAKRAASASSDFGWLLRKLTSISRQEWLAHVFRLCAMSPENRKDPRH